MRMLFIWLQRDSGWGAAIFLFMIIVSKGKKGFGGFPLDNQVSWPGNDTYHFLLTIHWPEHVTWSYPIIRGSRGATLLCAYKGRQSEILVKWYLPFTEHLSRARLHLSCAEGFSDTPLNSLNNPPKQGLLSSVTTWATWHSKTWSSLFKAAQWVTSSIRVDS